MTTPSEPHELDAVVQQLLGSLRSGPPGSRLSFFWNAQDPRSFFGPRGVTLWFDDEELANTCLALLSARPTHLAGARVDEARSILLDFMRYHFNFLEHRSSRPPYTTQDVAVALEAYLEEIRQAKLFLIPARRLSVVHDLVGSRIVLGTPTEPLFAGRQLPVPDLPPMDGGKYPPFRGDQPLGQLADTDCWLGCIATSDQEGFALIEALLGAVSLMLPSGRSRVFNMVSRIPYIYCTGGRWQARLDGPKFPSIIDDHQLGVDQLAGLSRLFEGPRTAELQQRIDLGLQFTGAGWTRPGRFGFLHNAIAFDALFGEDRKVGKSIRTKVGQLASSIPRVAERIDRLLRLRNALLHGSIGAVETSPEYVAYHRDLGADPYVDQIFILSACVRSLSN